MELYGALMYETETSSVVEGQVVVTPRHPAEATIKNEAMIHDVRMLCARCGQDICYIVQEGCPSCGLIEIACPQCQFSYSFGEE